MVIVNVKYLVTDGNRDKVLSIAWDTRKVARTMPGNIEYCAYASPDGDNEIFSIEKWESLDHLKDYIETSCCQGFIKKRAPYLVEGSKVTEIYESHAVSI